MSVEKVIEKLHEHDIILDTIPRGIKENVFVIIRDGENELRRDSGRSGRYADNCGVGW